MNRQEFRMAFDGHQTTLGNSLFQTCQRQTGVNVSGKNGCMPVPFVPNPVTSRSEYPDFSWSQESKDDPYELRCAQNAIKTRKPTDASCDGEADLLGLVSNILDEADSQDSFYSESLPTCNPIWSPKTLKEELLQYFQPEPKTFNNPSFIPNHLPSETFSKAHQQTVDKEVNELSQLSNGLAGGQQWSFNLPNGSSYSIRPPKLPPGLPLSNKLSADLSQIQQYKHSMPSYNSIGNDTPSKNVPVLNDIFRPQKDANTSCLDDVYEDQYYPSSVNPFFDERCVPEDMNQLVSSFRSFMPSDHGSSCGDSQSKHKPAVDMLREGLGQQYRKFKYPTVSAQNFPAAQTQKEPFNHMELMQNGRIGETRRQNFQLGDLQDLPEFSSERMEYFQKPKPFSAHLSFSNLHQNKMVMHSDNHNLNMNQYSKHYTRQNQKKFKPQMEKENKIIQMSGFTGEGFARRQQTNTHMAEGDKHRFSQSPYIDFQGNTLSQRRDGENITISAGKLQQFPPLPCSLNDLRRYSSMAMNSNLSSRSILPCENRGPHRDVNGMASTNEAAVLGSFTSDMNNHRGESTYHGVASTLTASLIMNQEGPAFQLHLYLDDCFEQLRSLEKERKKTEVILKKAFLGKRASVMTNTNPPKTPPRPTRVDYLIVNQMKEQAKVAGLFDRMEGLCGVPLHINIHAALKTHHMAVCITQSRRKEDSGNMTKQQQQGIHFTEDRDNPLMVMALKELASTTKRLRTAVWCALQTTLPTPVSIQDQDVYNDAASAERCSSPFLGYSFCL